MCQVEGIKQIELEWIPEDIPIEYRLVSLLFMLNKLNKLASFI